VVDARIRSLRGDIDGIRQMMRSSDDDRWDDSATVAVTATVLLRNANFVSVRYHTQPNLGQLSDSPWESYDTVTVDLRTGKALPLNRIFLPDSVDRLAGQLLGHTDDRLCTDFSQGGGTLDLTEENLGKEVTVAFTPDHATFTVALPAFGRANACGTQVVDIPYADLTEVLDPTLVRELTGG
jgi:hypothetical protein